MQDKTMLAMPSHGVSPAAQQSALSEGKTMISDPQDLPGYMAGQAADALAAQTVHEGTSDVRTDARSNDVQSFNSDSLRNADPIATFVGTVFAPARHSVVYVASAAMLGLFVLLPWATSPSAAFGWSRDAISFAVIPLLLAAAAWFFSTGGGGVHRAWAPWAASLIGIATIVPATDFWLAVVGAGLVTFALLRAESLHERRALRTVLLLGSGQLLLLLFPALREAFRFTGGFATILSNWLTLLILLGGLLPAAAVLLTDKLPSVLRDTRRYAPWIVMGFAVWFVVVPFLARGVSDGRFWGSLHAVLLAVSLYSLFVIACHAAYEAAVGSRG